jgi:putative ABC transport system permease protein
MYYKQISEGLEDKVNFDIMQKVGMSESEVRLTIRRQIKMIFFIPIVVAILHTAIALKIIASMMVLLRIYNTSLVLACAAVVILVFGIFYGISYIVTARAYYKITVNKSML